MPNESGAVLPIAHVGYTAQTCCSERWTSVLLCDTGPFPATSWPRDVSRAATNVIEVMRDGSCQPRELYGSLIEVFSKDGDLIIDIGSYIQIEIECLQAAAVRLKRP
ncbi:uncharacterized protein LOC122954860 isoform X1 [Acropora millepora]|uniref:uncharacterized protein LOC122954860 isoform X1 n=1 Tax=Acropora millepora TaxID=45264 RepID=UPI001CF3FBF1|nr:uncharacterized protein LOC122954860 isoform X1 [Acropora millepora]